MRRFLPSPRRLRTLLAAGAVGAVAAAAFGTPAFACHPAPDQPTVECNAQGQAEITWTVQMNSKADATIKSVVVTPDGSSWKAGNGIVVGAKIDQGKSVKGIQIAPLGAKKASLYVTASWKEGKKDVTLGFERGPVSVDLNCSVPTTPPTTPPSSASSGGASTSPSASGVASASSSAGASLPVTGANVALISGAAVLLLGVGAGLFLVARRRRVRFTA